MNRRGIPTAHVRRLVNIGRQLAERALVYGMTGFILAADDAYSIELFAAEPK